MRKKSVSFILIIILVLAFTACSQTPADNGPKGSDAGTQIPKTDAVLSGKIVKLNDRSFLLAGPGTHDLYSVSAGLDIYDSDGSPTDASFLKAGQTVEIGYSGLIMESYPAQLGDPAYIKITGEGDDLVGFYLTIADDLLNVDKGLNSEISILAFDLTEVENLTDSEKNALVWIAGGEYGLTGISGTHDELVEQGYIVNDGLYFEDGILIEFELSDVKEDSFTFDVQKWRSGLGAYFFIDCKAEKTDGVWRYTVGSEAIA